MLPNQQKNTKQEEEPESGVQATKGTSLRHDERGVGGVGQTKQYGEGDKPQAKKTWKGGEGERLW